MFLLVKGLHEGLVWLIHLNQGPVLLFKTTLLGILALFRLYQVTIWKLISRVYYWCTTKWCGPNCGKYLLNDCGILAVISDIQETVYLETNEFRNIGIVVNPLIVVCSSANLQPLFLGVLDLHRLQICYYVTVICLPALQIISKI